VKHLAAKSMAKVMVWLVVAGLAVTVVAEAAHAQPPGGPRGPRDAMLRALALSNTTGDPREMIKVFRVWKLTGTLDVSDEELTGLVAKLERLDEKQREVAELEQRALEDMQRLLDSKAAADADFAEALAKYEEVKRVRAEELRRLHEELMSSLTPRQRCAYVVFERDFRHDMRQMIGKALIARKGRLGRLRDDIREKYFRGRRGPSY